MPDSTFKSSWSTTTVAGTYNQFHSLANMAYVTHPETTINTKRNIFPASMPTKVPLIRYFGIGVKGFRNIDDGVLSQPYRPSASNLDLYQPVPFRCVPVAEDLDASTRANYRIRVRQTIGGEDYFVYWLKKIDFIDNTVKMNQVSPEGQSIPYIFDPGNLNPEPSIHDTPDILDCDTDRVIVSLTGRCRILGSEVAEAINVLFGGDLRYARISEVGFYTGEDKADAIGQDDQGNTLQYTESIYTQLATHRCTLGTDLSDPTGIHEENIVYESGSLLLL